MKTLCVSLSKIIPSHIHRDVSLPRKIWHRLAVYCNLPTVSKVLERLVLARLRPHLLSSANFSQFQSAYRKGHSTETALLFCLFIVASLFVCLSLHELCKNGWTDQRQSRKPTPITLNVYFSNGITTAGASREIRPTTYHAPFLVPPRPVREKIGNCNFPEMKFRRKLTLFKLREIAVCKNVVKGARPPPTITTFKALWKISRVPLQRESLVNNSP